MWHLHAASHRFQSCIHGWLQYARHHEHRHLNTGHFPDYELSPRLIDTCGSEHNTLNKRTGDEVAIIGTTGVTRAPYALAMALRRGS